MIETSLYQITAPERAFSSFCLLVLKILLAERSGEVGNCARPSIAPLFFRGVWAAAVIHGAALALDLDLGLAVSRPWLNNVLSKATQRPLYLLRGLGALWPCSGVLRPPETPFDILPHLRALRLRRGIPITG